MTRSSGSEAPGIVPSTWDRIAPWYSIQLFLERPALEMALALGAPSRTDSMIDLGCGTGALLSRCARLPPPRRPGRAVGVDASARMLDRVPPLPLGWGLRVAEATDLPYPDGSFDLGFCTYVLHLLDARTRRRAIEELHRIIRPGGRVVTVTPLPVSHPAAGRRARFSATLGRKWPSVVGGLRPCDPSRELARSGFTVQAARTVGRGYPSLCLLATSLSPRVRPQSAD